MNYDLSVNGHQYQVDAPASYSLLDVLREVLGLVGTKYNCEQGECGACTVLLNGRAVNSCLILAATAVDKEITTIEGAAESPFGPELMEAFIDRDAAQCGYCTPGMVMSGLSLFRDNPTPSRDEVRRAIGGNYCRCTGYYSIIAAFEQASVKGSLK
jgi:aerobic carbon-monoxide dehydrogenase small subunit